MVAWLAVPLTLFTIYCVYSPPFGLTEGAHVLWVSAPLAAYIVWLATSPKPGKSDDAIQAFRRFKVYDEEPDDPSAGYRDVPHKPSNTVLLKTVILKTVVAAPYDLGFLLDRLGIGVPRVVFELHPRIAFAVVVEANELSISDHFTLLLRLDQAATTLSVRPVVTTEAPPSDLVPFKKDEEFNQRFHVIGKDAKAVRGFLSGAIRDALLDVPGVSVEVQGKAMSLSIFGPFDADAARQLVEVADTLFAEYGAEDGPSLVEPSGEVVEKKKKKKKASAASPAGATS
jgi:hypothetical protein